jgi:hypothetical protein
VHCCSVQLLLFLTAESHFSSLLDDLSSQVETVEAEVSSLEASTVDTIFVAELLGHCNELYLQNASAIQQLEVHLEQYGYNPGEQCKSLRWTAECISAF